MHRCVFLLCGHGWGHRHLLAMRFSETCSQHSLGSLAETQAALALEAWLKEVAGREFTTTLEADEAELDDVQVGDHQGSQGVVGTDADSVCTALRGGARGAAAETCACSFELR